MKAVRRIDVIFACTLLAALLLRLHLARTERYIHDEENTSIPLSRSISFVPGHVNLPLRGENHGALPAYVVKVSSTLFGTSMLGYRMGHLLLGLATIVLMFVLTRDWYGPVAARWAAALLAFNEYYLPISARATAQAPTLFFDLAAIFAFARFLRAGQARYLYIAGIAVALAFYCKESSALLLPLFFVALIATSRWAWLLRPHPYVACLVFAAMLAPDFYWNMTTNRETARATYGQEPVGYATYRSHLQRIGGLGFSPYPAMFYARGPVMSLHQALTGTELRDETPEYHSIDPWLGALLVGAVVVTTLGRRRDDLQRYLLILFWGLFGFFTLIAKGDPPGRLDPVSWIWVEATMFPAIVLTGVRLAETTGSQRVVAWSVAAALILYAIYTIVAA